MTSAVDAPAKFVGDPPAGWGDPSVPVSVKNLSEKPIAVVTFEFRVSWWRQPAEDVYRPRRYKNSDGRTVRPGVWTRRGNMTLTFRLH